MDQNDGRGDPDESCADESCADESWARQRAAADREGGGGGFDADLAGLAALPRSLSSFVADIAPILKPVQG